MHARHVLLLALLSACSDSGAAPTPPAPPPAPPVAAPAPDFTRVPTVSVHAATHPRATPATPSAAAPVTLAITSEAPVDHRAPEPARPAWLPAQIDGTYLERFTVEPDGSAVALYNRGLLLLDRDHQPELRIQIGDLGEPAGTEPTDLWEKKHSTPPQPLPTIAAFHRVGARVIVAIIHHNGILPNANLIAIDVPSGELAWRSDGDLSDFDFAIAGDHAISVSSFKQPRSLVAISLATGATDAALPIAHERYVLTRLPSGEIAGLFPPRVETGDVPLFELRATLTTP